MIKMSPVPHYILDPFNPTASGYAIRAVTLMAEVFDDIMVSSTLEDPTSTARRDGLPLAICTLAPDG